ncbi:MAG: TlpA family protein disulfide reductase [Steroidobacteraceae bacterium]
MSRGSRVAVAVLLVAAAGPAGFLAYRFLASEHLIAPPGARSGTVLDAAQLPAVLARSQSGSAGETPQKPIPEVLPDISLPDAQGTTRRLSAWIGHPLIVNFWATWCEPCRREIPLLETLRRRSTDHLEVVGIAVDDRGPVLQYMRRMNVDYPVLIAGGEGGLAAIDAFGMQAVLPFSVFADTHGRIVAVKVGELHPDDAALILARLADVDEGRLRLQQARDRISSGLAALAAARARASAPPSAPPPAKSISTARYQTAAK